MSKAYYHPFEPSKVLIGGIFCKVKEWLQSLGIVDQMAVVPDVDEPDDGAVPLNTEERSKAR